MLWTRPLEPASFTPRRFPVCSMEAPSGHYYAFPNHRGQGFKIGKYHHLGEQLDDPYRVDRTCRAADETVLREGIAQYFPSANGPAIRSSVCIFTNTPDEHFVLDRHPTQPNVYLAAGFSGHGFKFCSVVGKIMTEFCLDVRPSWDLGRFRLSAARRDRWKKILGRSGQR